MTTWLQYSYPTAGVSPLPTLIYIVPLFLSETVTRSRVVTPDSVITMTMVSALGDGADSIRENDADVSILKDRKR
jgi:hypothetical protein